jgi:putative tricarboxylic transport membrane protein
MSHVEIGMLWQGALLAFKWANLAALVGGTIWGLVIGALPALGSVYAVALLLPLTFYLPLDTSLILLVSSQISCIWGDSIASIVVNTPGGPASVASCWDGYPMARQGKAGMALGISLTATLIGGIVGWTFLVLVSRPVAAFSVKFGSPEYFLIGVLAISLVGVLAKGSMLKGILLGGLGVFMATIGMNPLTGTTRFTFGTVYLLDGLPFVPVVLGLFAFAQIIRLMAGGGESIAERVSPQDSPWRGIVESIRRPITIIRSSIIGFYIGVLPLLGINVANVLAYTIEKRSSKEPETFGQGNISGLLSAEVGKSCCLFGDLVPTFAIGIPGSPTSALFLSALMIQGVQPGAAFFKGTLHWTVFVGFLMALVAVFLLGFPLLKPLSAIVRVPTGILVPVLTALTFTGAVATRSEIRDILVVIVFGVMGYIWDRKGYPLMCLVLGMLLGDMLEKNLLRSLAIGGWGVFLSRPISAVLLIILVGYLTWPYLFGRLFERLWRKKAPI